EDHRRRLIHARARERRSPHEHRVRPGGRWERKRSRDRHDQQRDARAPGHASARRPDLPMRLATATTSASTASASATIPSVLLPPPPSEAFASIVGAGVSADSGPDQSTTLPSEYVCRTVNAYV